MNPALLNFGLAQEQADGALGGTNSPISNGALTAIRSVKQSLAMDEAEKRRALGLGIMGLGSALSKPGYGQGLSGMLGAVNAGFSPAIQAYLNEQNRVEQQNANILKTAMDAEDKQAERDFRERQLQETKRYHDLLAQAKDKESKIEREVSRVEKLHPDAIPLFGMSQGQVTDVHKKREEILQDSRKIDDVIENVKILIKTDEDNPGLYSDIRSTLNPDGPGRYVMPSKMRAARKKADLASNNLALDQIKRGVGSARMGQFLEKMVRDTKINYLTPLEDKKRVLADLEQERKIINSAAAEVKKAKKGRYDLPDYFDYTDKDEDLSQVSTEELMRMLNNE